MSFSRLLPRFIAGAALVAALALVAMPPPDGIEPTTMQAAAVVLFALAFWATGVLAEYLVSIIFMLAAILLAVAPPAVVFSGFHSPALWLVFGGMLIGTAVRDTGLGARFARAILGRFAFGYAAMIAGIVFAGVALTFVMPSAFARIMVLMVPVLALADQLGFEKGSKGRIGMAIAAAYGAFIPGGGILPANVPNVIFAGSVETIHDIAITYGSYLQLHFPVTGGLRAIALIVLVCLMYSESPRKTAAGTPERQPLSGDERRLGVFLVIALLLWVSDFVHGVSPAWVALAGGLACLLPRIGMLPAENLSKSANFGTLFYVAGLLAVGNILVDSGVADVLRGLVLDYVEFQPGADARNFGLLFALSALLGMVATNAGVAPILTPLANSIAEATQLPLMTVLMTQVLGFSTVIFPYQVAPLLVANQLGGIPLSAAVRICLALTAVTVFLLLPANYFWWRALGYFG